METETFFQMVRYALGHGESTWAEGLSAEQWEVLYDMALRQAIGGVVWRGVMRLPKHRHPPFALMLRWQKQAADIAARGDRLNHLVDVACRGFGRAGFASCLLKGQGTALRYPDPLSRVAGDIDLWLDLPPGVVPAFWSGDSQPMAQAGTLTGLRLGARGRRADTRRGVVRYVLHYFPQSDVRYHHVAFPALRGVDVEAHYEPVPLCNPWLRRRLRRWVEEQRACQFAHRVTVGDALVAVPTPAFARVYEMLHLMKHVLEEGIGLRQLMDYYYLLVAAPADEADRQAAMQVMRRLHVDRLAGAVMYVLHEVFGLDPRLMLCAPDEGEGRFLLDEVMLAGNFGHYDPRLRRGATGEKSRRPEAPSPEAGRCPEALSVRRFLGEAAAFWHKTRRNLRFAVHYPHEALWEPPFRIYHWAWRHFRLWR